ncbi:MAG: XRE family transcriptional regulator [Dehalococcoidia bacterium]|nr:MAG: XRE family transcriptional regulator [Dehalococcoidia bacterium]
MDIGDRINAKRLELGLTQKDLAQALGLTPQHISAIEKNHRLLSLDMLWKIAEQLGVTTDYLTTGKPGVIVDTIPAIKADKRLNLKSKRALISLIEQLYKSV